MPGYDYVAQRLDGTLVRGKLDAIDKFAARSGLGQQSLKLVRLEESAGTLETTMLAWLSDWRAWPHRFLARASARHIEIFLEQLAVMLETGLPLVEALEHCQQTFASRGIRLMCSELIGQIAKGESFADAVDHVDALLPIVRHLITVGEASGDLPTVLREAARFMTSRRETNAALLGALAYPSIIAVAATAVAVYLVGWVIPKLAGMLESMGRTMPPMTQTLVDLSVLARTYGTESAVLLVLTCIGLLFMYVRPQSRIVIDRWLLQVPMLGSVLRMAESLQLSSSLALMLRSGVPLQNAIRTAATAHRNRYLGGIVASSVERLGQGESLSVALRGFDPLLNSLISIGERTGELAEALEHVAKLYTGQLDNRLKYLSRLIEPAIIIVAGGAVGYVYAAFFMALMSTGANFK